MCDPEIAESVENFVAFFDKPKAVVRWKEEIVGLRAVMSESLKVIVKAESAFTREEIWMLAFGGEEMLLGRPCRLPQIRDGATQRCMAST